MTAFDMETVWGHTRGALLATSPVPGISLMGASRQLNGRARAGVQHADLNACNAYRPSMEAIRALDVPTLIVGGKRDQMTPIKAAEALSRDIPLLCPANDRHFCSSYRYHARKPGPGRLADVAPDSRRLGLQPIETDR